jgi:hypothetical protein
VALTASPQRDRRPAILSALAALALYAITLGGTFVYDDRFIVQADPRLTNVSRWDEYWTTDYFLGGADNLYRPLVSMSYAIQSKLHGNGDDRAWLFHLVNWLLHAGVSALVAELARRMTMRAGVALAAGLLFAAHPIHVEAVTNIVGRAELMCGLGMIGALVIFMRPLTVKRAIAIWLCFVFALLSKEQGILLPLLLIAAIPCRRRVVEPDNPSAAANGAAGVIDYAQRDTPRLGRFSAATLTLVLLLLWTLAGYIFVRERILKFWWDRSFLDATINPIVRSEGADRWLMPLVLLGRYVALLVAPLKLSFDYGGATIGSHVRMADPYFIVGVASAVAGALAIIATIRRRAWTAMLCLLAAATLFGMVSNLPTIIGVNFAERLMYIPSAFLCILAAMALARLPRQAMIAILVIVMTLFSIRTVTYAWRWNDRLRLFERAAAESPQNVRTHMILAEELSRRGRFDDALAAAARAREVDPNYYKIWMQSALIALKAGRFDEAERFAARSHLIQPTDQWRKFLIALDAARAATRPATQPSP